MEARRSEVASDICWWIPKVCSAESKGTQHEGGSRSGRVKAALLECARTGISSIKHLWLGAGYQGRGRRGVEEVTGSNVKIVRKLPKPVPEKVAKIWAEEWAKEGEAIDWEKLMPPRGF